MGSEIDWADLDSRVRAELNRADLTDRQACVAEVLVSATLSRKRARVRIIRLDELAAVLGYSKGNVHGTLFGVNRPDGTRSPGLVAMGIVQFEKLAGGGAEYRIMPDSAQWAVGWRYDAREMTAFLRDLDAVCSQVQPELIEPDPGLKSALADGSLERAAAVASVPDSGTVRPSRFPNREPDPQILHFKALKLKGTKLKALSFESLKGAVHVLGDPDEKRAMAAVRQIIGDEAMLNDGGKWCLRWRSNREKVHRVFASMVGDSDTRSVKSPAAYAEWLWRDMI